MIGSHTYLTPSAVAQLSSIEMKARLIVEGFMSGMHKSPYHGFSVEFAEHRQYHPGDDLRYLDWKILGKTNRHYIKQFEEETNLRCTVIIDTSASMKYASKGNVSKFDYAACLGAAFTYLMMKQQDAAGLALYNDSIVSYLPAKKKTSYVGEILRVLGNAVPSNITGTAKALHQLVERLPKRGMVIIISDFFDEMSSIVQALKHFRHDGHEVIAIQVLDPREIDFSFGLDANFRDIETGEELITQPYHIKKAYAEGFMKFMAQLKHECRVRGVEYLQIDTHQPYELALREYLYKRSKA
ncbi:MAG: hypothetical protein RLZZ578_1335 [Bacteroidota bacterium]|jgi:uncharacterized protein (DUF58 family)